MKVLDETFHQTYERVGNVQQKLKKKKLNKTRYISDS